MCNGMCLYRGWGWGSISFPSPPILVCAVWGVSARRVGQDRHVCIYPSNPNSHRDLTKVP